MLSAKLRDTLNIEGIQHCAGKIIMLLLLYVEGLFQLITRAKGAELRFQLCVFFGFCWCWSWSACALCMWDQFEPRAYSYAINKMPDKKLHYLLHIIISILSSLWYNLNGWRVIQCVTVVNRIMINSDQPSSLL